MVDRVPLTLFTQVTSISTHATWVDPLNPSDPWNGYPYQWAVTTSVQSQSHSDPSTPRPFTYNGFDVNIGDWLVFSSSAMALEIISITVQGDSELTMIVEDVSLHNLLNNPAQSGQGIGPTSAAGEFDCLIITLNSTGVPIFAPLADYSVPINLVADITNRFQFRNYIQDFIPATQPGHGFSVGDVIYIDRLGNYTLSSANLEESANSIGTVTSINQPSVGDFTYRPIGRYVTNLPELPGVPGQRLYVSGTELGGLVASQPSPYAVPIYIKISNTSGILTTGAGGGGSGNISILGNTISSVNQDGNIILNANGNGTIQASNLAVNTLAQGRVVIVGENGRLIDTGYLTYDSFLQALSVGNVRIASDYISTNTAGVPLILTTAGGANVQVLTDLDLSGNRGVNAQDPIEPQDLATKGYVDAVASGLSPKAAVYLATTNDLNAVFNPLIGYGALTGISYQQLEIDGEYPTVDSRILVKNQTNQEENGIYRVAQVGNITEPWILFRTNDFNGQGISGQVSSGDFVFVTDGSINADTGWVMTTPNPITVNTSPIIWTQFSAAGVIQAGFGLTKNGTVLDVNVAAIIDQETGLNASPGPLGFNIIEINVGPTTPLEFYNGALRVKSSIAGTGLSYNPLYGNINVLSNQATVTGLGNVTSGTWSADTIAIEHGGTGNIQIGLPSQALVVNDDGTGLEYQYRSKLTEGSEPPYLPSPADGDKWFNTDTGIMFTRITDANGGHWVEL